ncbi:Addiction module antidote protein [Pseudomonas batumici]|uniref:Addiction module antidote protein n=1 Tax=Pseudomonas batumici TaxID=226910 RepID=A0A0C2I888_9PSED|nr:Addiction module antidote protein [Pseudomonas batumici]
MNEPFYDYDPASALGDPESIAVFMADAFETGDVAHIAQAMGAVARAKGMADLARELGLPLEQQH